MPAVENVLELVRPEILKLKPYTCARDTIKEGLLMDANENPFPRWQGNIPVNRYPDPRQEELRAALSRFTRLPVSSILAASGSDEVFDWLFKVFCAQGKDAVAIFEPTYGMYEVTAGIFGIPVRKFQLDREFEFRADYFLEGDTAGIKMLFLCSPNNPTGNLVAEEEIKKVLENWKGIVVVDEAYIEFSGAVSASLLVEEYPGLVVTRTLSKAFGSAGIRLGYVLADPEVIDLFLKVKLPYNLNAMTQKAGLEAMENIQEAIEDIDLIVSERERLESELAVIDGLEIVTDSQANFILIRCEEARSVYESLFDKGIIIRDRGTQHGLGNCLRVSVGTPEENNQFLQELIRILGERSGK